MVVRPTGDIAQKRRYLMVIGHRRNPMRRIGFMALFGGFGALLGGSLSGGSIAAIVASTIYGLITGLLSFELQSQISSVYLVKQSVRFWPRRQNPLQVGVAVMVILAGQLSLIAAVDYPRKGIINVVAPLSLILVIIQILIYRSARFRTSIPLDQIDTVEIRHFERADRVVILSKDHTVAVLPCFDNPKAAMTSLGLALGEIKRDGRAPN
jgi:hypothetical protein